jgi:hypothetical protein
MVCNFIVLALSTDLLRMRLDCQKPVGWDSNLSNNTTCHKKTAHEGATKIVLEVSINVKK